MITKTKPRPWTKQDIADLNDLKKKNIHTKTIAYILDRSEVAVQIKWKRLNKTNNTYNEKHIKKNTELMKTF